MVTGLSCSHTFTGFLTFPADFSLELTGHLNSPCPSALGPAWSSSSSFVPLPAFCSGFLGFGLLLSTRSAVLS